LAAAAQKKQAKQQLCPFVHPYRE